MEGSSEIARLTGRRARGAPVYAYGRVAGVPPISVLRFSGPALPGGEPAADHAHAHEFLVLVYVERGGGSLRLDGREWPLAEGDAFIIAPGEVVAVGDAHGLRSAQAWAAFFPADVLEAPGGFLSWRSHPLLFPFVGRAGGGVQRLSVPPAERAAWSARFAALDDELRARRDGSDDAARAHLTLLLVGVSRLAADVARDLRIREEPVLADVFAFVEAHFAEPISLADVARTVGLTPGHLTTVVGRKTGRTVQRWITERRMAEARRLLVATDDTVAAIGVRVGYADAGYFIRTFRRAHGTTPLRWRRADRPPAPSIPTPRA